VTRCSALLRLAEQLERSRDQAVDDVAVDVRDDCVELVLDAHEDVAVARWAALKQRELFEEAFGKRLEISVAQEAAEPARS
jgi:exopolyphosphatase/guanosine-5'-triphosphate,3'-diphosphate pyrophosphatase